LALVGQLNALEEAPAALAGDVVDAGPVEQVALQRGRDLVLGAAALAHQLRPPRDQAPQRPGPLVRAPDLGQITRCQQLRQPPRVDDPAQTPRSATLKPNPHGKKGVSMRGRRRLALSEMRRGHLSTPYVPEYRLAIHDGARVVARFICSGAASLGRGCP
jgi:hypothetical protein